MKQRRDAREFMTLVVYTLVNVNAVAKARTYWLRQFQRYG